MRVAGWAVFLAASIASAEAPWNWPDKAKNLKVLPSTTTGPQLKDEMVQFSGLLGVRCSYCHVGEEGKPLSSYDFVSDANPNKDRAREMMRMVDSINAHLDKLKPSGDQRVGMYCHTCHRGRPRPMTLEEELSEVYRRGGANVAGVIAHYRELKEKYLEKGAYDFSGGALDWLGHDLLEKKDVAGAIAIGRLSATEHPQSSRAWSGLAEAYLASGSRQAAQIYYAKAVEMDPQNEKALKKLRELAAPGAK